MACGKKYEIGGIITIKFDPQKICIVFTLRCETKICEQTY